ncbi:uncharacterized protein An04g10180 [Aspergillus niger]|uniref:Contig An04c0380, genomic contig n=2 Tax=Aspergillus niger TaxID=5061 RepID=A2QKD0_ASPNC|nr:uncharacterized protein An04g10180 [Aspergillus niger]CAK32625.1 unnamed protein product [Aspergillus niger]
MTEAEEGIAERRKERTAMALHEDATGAPTSSEVESKESYNMTIPEFVASLHEMNLALDVTDREGDTLISHGLGSFNSILEEIC